MNSVMIKIQVPKRGLQRSTSCISLCFLVFFRDGTTILVGGVHRERLVLYAAPDRSINM